MIAARLERVFAECFADGWRTRLSGGAEEPYYRPATDVRGWHVLHYRADYFASALHEAAHWCIAGERRRQLPDFGYWYAPDGRNAVLQRAFERVEAKPQALEWLFSRACGHRFRPSVDNLGAAGGHSPDTGDFRRLVLAQAITLQQRGLPPRALVFFNALAQEFGSGLEVAQLILDPVELLA